MKPQKKPVVTIEQKSNGLWQIKEPGASWRNISADDIKKYPWIEKWVSIQTS